MSDVIPAAPASESPSGAGASGTTGDATTSDSTVATPVPPAASTGQQSIVTPAVVDDSAGSFPSGGITERERLREALKRSASALKAAGIPFALAGGYALWVRGAPESEHDVDLAVPEANVEQAAACLSEAGFAIERPPEDWLFKAYLNGAMVDVLHRINGIPVEPALLDLAEETEVLGLRMPVLPAHQVVTSKLLSMTERYCDFGGLIPAVRAVREQLDWPKVRAVTADSPYAAAFLLLTDRLGISDQPA